MRTSEDKFRVMVDTIPALVWCARPDGSNEFHNQRWHDYTGLPEGAEHGWGWKVVYHPEDLEALLNKFRSIVASGEAGEMEARLRRTRCGTTIREARGRSESSGPAMNAERIFRPFIVDADSTR